MFVLLCVKRTVFATREKVWNNDNHFLDLTSITQWLHVLGKCLKYETWMVNNDAIKNNNNSSVFKDPSKHEMLAQHWFTVVPPSTTLDQQWTNVVPTSHVCWDGSLFDPFLNTYGMTVPVNIMFTQCWFTIESESATSPNIRATSCS